MKFGCLKSPTDLRDYKLSIDKKQKYPDKFKVNIKQFNIKNQGKVSSCVAHATASILEYYSDLKLSTNFIYGIRKKLYNSTNMGMTLRDACRIVYTYGDMEYNDCPGNTEIEKVFSIAEESFKDENKLNRAYKYKIDLYVNLFRNIDSIKYFLTTYGPVLAAIPWFKSSALDNNFILNNDKSDIVPSSYHAIVIYGWEDNYWLCQNSWGSKWGNNGLFKLKMDGLIEAYGLIDSNQDGNTGHIKRPTKGILILEWVLKFINFLIAKLNTKIN